jgi:hypothetical protein
MEKMDNLNEYEKLVQVAIETAFDKENRDTELLLRRLLAMGKIRLIDGQYSRDPLDYEKHFRIDGIEYDREKMFFIENDKLDEYTRQLEVKVKNLEEKVKEVTDERNNLSWELEQAQDKLNELDYGG